MKRLLQVINRAAEFPIFQDMLDKLPPKTQLGARRSFARVTNTGRCEMCKHFNLEAGQRGLSVHTTFREVLKHRSVEDLAMTASRDRNDEECRQLNREKTGEQSLKIEDFGACGLDSVGRHRKDRCDRWA